MRRAWRRALFVGGILVLCGVACSLDGFSSDYDALAVRGCAPEQGVKLCKDFEENESYGAGFQIDVGDGGAFGRDTTTSISPPQSLVAVIPAEANHRVAVMSRAFMDADPTRIRLAAHVRLISFPHVKDWKAELLKIAFNQSVSLVIVVYENKLYVSRRADKQYLDCGSLGEMPDGSKDHWARVEIVLEAGPPLKLKGRRERSSDWVPLEGCPLNWSLASPTLYIGMPYAKEGPAPWIVRYDNVIFDFSP
ncbi:hypothetical protein LZC95_50980 [Pendulispora brunnea]|uniref:Uncharacterized protein n=1 Tax=Pendulispora brunnea TaxID=2905690 RepID=A0ABZ2KBM9_9BACT